MLDMPRSKNDDIGIFTTTKHILCWKWKKCMK